MTAISVVRPSSPVRSQSTIGTRSSPIPPSPTPSSTASSTTLIASHSRETVCARSPLSVPNLTPPRKTEPTRHAGNETRPPSSERWPPSIGTHGRVQSEPPAAIIGIRTPHRDVRWLLKIHNDRHTTDLGHHLLDYLQHLPAHREL